MQTLEISTVNALQAYNAADTNGKKLLELLLGKQNFNLKITERVNDFNDVLAIAGKTMEDMAKPGDTEDEIAYKQAKLIAQVYNEGDELDPKNTNQYKYYPWHKIVADASKPSGFGLSFGACGLLAFGFVCRRSPLLQK